MKSLIGWLLFGSVLSQVAFAQEEHTFDLSEIVKKPVSLGGYIELRPVLSGLDRNASSYKLRFYNRDEGSTLEEYNSKLQVDASYEKRITKLFIRVNTDLRKSYLGWSDKITIYEGYLSLKPSTSFTLDIGKKTLKWGKGYAWNPVAFIDRPKDPDEPELALEGFIVASADYIKSFHGPLKTFSFTPVLIPVSKHVNDKFGDIDKLNLAAKAYLLLHDTDIDLIFLTGGSKTTRWGLDFSRNITSNFEVHGEYAFIDDYRKRYIDPNGQILEKRYDARSYLLGIRYLTKSEATIILEYYRSGTGFSGKEMKDYFSFIDSAYKAFVSSKDDSSLRKAASITEGSYGRMNPIMDYLYLRVSQKDAFKILYFNPSIISIYNLDDQSFSLTLEMLYQPVTDLELRSRITLLAGRRGSEYEEKPSDFRVEFRIRRYF